MVARVEVGAVGWEHESWSEDFYPDELPEEWMLSYYANEFRCVLVPHNAWFDADMESVEQWNEDVHDQFRFIIEFSPNPGSDLQAAPILERLGALGERLVGIVFKPHEDLSILDDEVRALLVTLASNADVYVDLPASQLDEASLDIVTALGCKVCWSSANGDEVHGSCLGLVRADVINGDLRLMRAEVQKFMSQLGHCSDAFLLIAGPPPIQLMRDTMVILSLLDA